MNILILLFSVLAFGFSASEARKLTDKANTKVILEAKKFIKAQAGSGRNYAPLEEDCFVYLSLREEGYELDQRACAVDNSGPCGCWARW